MTARSILDVYVEANLILLLVLAIWTGTRWAQRLFGQQLSHRSQLRLLHAFLICALASPVLSAGLSSALGKVSPGISLSATDLAVASFLQGDLNMKATEFEAILNVRANWSEAILAQDGFVSNILAVSILAGFAFFAARIVLATARVRRTISGSFFWRRTGRVDVHLSDRVSIPFAVRGLRRYHVVLPSSVLYRPDDLRIALAHEFQHIRQGDTVTELFLELLRPIFFWNPGFLGLKREFGRAQELACDEHVVNSLAISARRYADSILGFCGASGAGARGHVFAVALVRWSPTSRRRSSMQLLKMRFQSLCDAKSNLRPRPMVFAATLALLSGSLAVSVASLRGAGDWSHDRLMLSTVVNLERLQDRNSQ